MPSSTTRPHAWWKPTGDTLAAYLSLDETRRMLASSAVLAPSDWQRQATVTLGERLGKLLVGTLRGGLSVGTLGLSDIMFRLSKPGLLAGNEDIPPLDLVVGPTEAAILITDGAVSSVLTAERLSTHDEWQRIDKLLGHGPHLEVVMYDRAPISLVIPMCVAIGDEEVRGQVDVDLRFGLEGADRVLNLLARSGGSLEGSTLNAPESGADDRASFITAASLADRIQRRLDHRVTGMQFARGRANELVDSADQLHQAELELTEFLIDELGVYGMTVDRCQLLLGRTEAQQLAIDQRVSELEQARKAMLAEASMLDEQRQATLEAERRAIEQELKASEISGEGELQKIGETNRFALARMVLQDDQALARIESEGFAERRQSERAVELDDFRQSQLLLREERARELEDELASAKTEVETGRIRMQLERQKLEIAALAQDQNLANLRQIKEIEREDDLLREQSRADAERHRFAAAKDLSPEQMMAALADKDPEIARALGTRFGSEAEFALKSAQEQKELMRDMQAQMARLMEKGLDANASVAGGLVGSVRTALGRPQTVAPGAASATAKAPCGHCGEPVDQTWKVCPFCEARLASS